MFGRKKRDGALFGARVEPKCEYCAHGVPSGEETACLLFLEPKKGRCKKYEYDPLKREPLRRPKLREYDPEEFKL